MKLDKAQKVINDMLSRHIPVYVETRSGRRFRLAYIGAGTLLPLSNQPATNTEDLRSFDTGVGDVRVVERSEP